jgi:hypothetical protein
MAETPDPIRTVARSLVLLTHLVETTPLPGTLSATLGELSTDMRWALLDLEIIGDADLARAQAWLADLHRQALDRLDAQEPPRLEPPPSPGEEPQAASVPTIYASGQRLAEQ